MAGNLKWVKYYPLIYIRTAIETEIFLLFMIITEVGKMNGEFTSNNSSIKKSTFKIGIQKTNEQERKFILIVLDIVKS